jgi:hypothetical protein
VWQEGHTPDFYRRNINLLDLRMMKDRDTDSVDEHVRELVSGDDARMESVFTPVSEPDDDADDPLSGRRVMRARLSARRQRQRAANGQNRRRG